jgi:hypothetical protein
MTVSDQTPQTLDRLPTDFREADDENGYVFGSSEPGADGNSRYYGVAVTVRNPFEEIGEQQATDETVGKLLELASSYKEGEVDDSSHLDPRGPFYTEEFAIEFAVDYLPGEDNAAAYNRLCAETDYLRCHHECGVFFTFRDRFAEQIGVDLPTLYPEG